MEFIKVKPGMFGLTLGYLDDNWMRVAEEAKRRGAVVTYHRFVEQSAPGSDRNIVLVTEFKNQTAYVLREKLFDSIDSACQTTHRVYCGLRNKRTCTRL
jgi:hypothetical protein